jgi:PqqD family protein of HPr-rel-A system
VRSLGFKVKPDVVGSSFDEGEAVLVDLSDRNYFVLNETAMAVFEAIQKEMSRDALLESLLERFDVTAAEADAGIDQALRDLEARGLLIPN